MQYFDAHKGSFVTASAQMTGVWIAALTIGGIDVSRVFSLNRILNVRVRGIILLILIINLIILG